MSVPIRTAFGANVRGLRLKLGLSQEKLGEQARLDMTYVSGIEHGVRNPTLEVIGRLTMALNTDAGVLCRDITERREVRV